MDTYLLPALASALDQLATVITRNGMSVQHMLPYVQLTVAYTAAQIESAAPVTPDEVRTAIRNVALIENETQRGYILMNLAQASPVDMLHVVAQRVAELQYPNDRRFASNVLEERHRSGRSVWSSAVYGVSSTPAARQVVDQLSAQGVVFDRHGIAYKGTTADPLTEPALRIGDYDDTRLGVALIRLPGTDASPEGWVAIFIQEIDAGDRRNMFVRLTPPKLLAEAAAAATRKADLWLQSSHTRAATYPVAALTEALRPWMPAPPATPVFSADDVDAVYQALWAREQNRDLDVQDADVLCRHLGISLDTVNRGLTILTWATLFAAPSPDAVPDDVRGTSAVISRKPLVGLGLANSAFALQPRRA